MTTPNILYSKSKFHLIRDYPELCEPDVQFDCLKSIGCGCAEAVAKSLASAIEFVEEDHAAVKELIWQSFDKDKEQTKRIFWEPTDGQLFTVEGIEVTIETYQEPTVSQFDLQAGRVPMGSQISVSRQVVRLKAKSDGQTNVDEYHDATGRITREEFYTGIKWPLQAQIDLVKARIEYYSKEPLCSSEVGKHNLSIWKSTLTTLESHVQPKDSAPPEPKGEWGFVISERPLSGEKGDSTQEIMLSNGEWEFFASMINMSDEKYAELQAIADKLNQSTQ